MSLQQSNLSASGLGYDMIVAMSQSGLTEATGDKYDNLSGKSVTEYWSLPFGLSDAVPTAYADLKLPANVNPFLLPAWTTANGANTKISALQTAKFAMAAKGTPGIPDSAYVADPTDPTGKTKIYPKIMTLNSDGTADLTLYFLDLQVVAAIYDSAGNIIQYLNVSQDDDTPMTIVFRMPFKSIVRNDNLPPAVQQALGTTDITVQQLVLNTGVTPYLTGLAIPGLDQMSCYPSALNNCLGGQCQDMLADAGVTAVGYSAATETLLPASLTITSLAGRGDMLVDANGKIIVNQNSDQQSINTLNLYCATNGEALPAPVQLPWNWLETPMEGNSYDGAIAIKFSAFVNYLKSIMDPYVAGNCYLPVVYTTFPDVLAPTLSAGQTPQTINVYTTNNAFLDPTMPRRMLTYGYKSPVVSNNGVGGITISMYSTFDLNVTFTTGSITVEQLLIVHADIDLGAGLQSIDIVNTHVLDSCLLKVDAKGYLALDVTSSAQNNSNYQSVDTDNWPPYLQNYLPDLAGYVSSVVSGSLKIDPLNQLQKFVFPAGKTFMFSDAAMSNYGDLVAHIKFVENPL